MKNIPLEKIKQTLIYIIIATLPIMTFIEPFGKVKINFAISDIFMALLVLVTIINYLYKRFKNTTNYEPLTTSNFPYWWYFTGFLLLMLISNTRAYFSPDIQASSLLVTINEAIKFLIVGCYFYTGYYSYTNKRKFQNIIRTWTYTSLIVGLIGIIVSVFLFAGYTESIPYLFIKPYNKRLTATLTDANLAASYFNISFYIAILLKTYNNKNKYIGNIELFILLISIILTQSRSGILAFVISIILYFIINIKQLYKYTLIILMIICILYFGILNIDAVFFEKNFSASLDRRMSQIKDYTGEFIVRSNLAKSAFHMGQDYPLIGVGRGNYNENSKKYLVKFIDTESQNYISQYKGKIPHNTYATFFAELGFLGLFLFVTIFLKVFKVIIKKLRKQTGFKTYSILVAILTSYLIQAAALNLENFRGVWIILGIITTYNKIYDKEINRQIHLSTKDKQPKKIYIILLLISSLVFLNTASKYTKPIKFEDEYKNELINVKSDEKYVFRYYIKDLSSKVKDDLNKKTSFYIRIYSIDSKNKEQLLNEVSYGQPEGWGNLLFKTKPSTHRIKIEFIPINENNKFEVKEGVVTHIQKGEGIKVFRDYRFIPNNFERKFIDIGLIDTSTNENINEYKLFRNTSIYSYNDIKNSTENKGTKSIYFDGNNPITISDKVLFLGAKSKQLKSGKTKLKLIFKCIGDMEVDYNIWLHGKVIDKYILSQKRFKQGFENWDHSLELKTSSWSIGTIYEHEYIIETNPGQYFLRFGFWNSKWIDNMAYRLNPAINLGWIQIK